MTAPKRHLVRRSHLAPPPWVQGAQTSSPCRVVWHRNLPSLDAADLEQLFRKDRLKLQAQTKEPIILADAYFEGWSRDAHPMHLSFLSFDLALCFKRRAESGS